MLFALPWPSISLARHVIGVVRSPADVALVGASTIDHVSDCDQDRRNLAVMLGDTAGRNVLDLSDGGQPLWRSINLAALAGRYGHAKDVVLPIEFEGLDVPSVPPYRELLLYKLFNVGFSVFRSESVESFWTGISGQPQMHDRGFTFEGVTYPDYRGISAKWFAREMRAWVCPEQTTVDPAFVRAYYWWLYIAQQTNFHLLDMVGELSAYLVSHQRQLHVVILPTNFELIGQLDASWVAALRSRQDAIAQRLRDQNVDVLNLSESLDSDDFSTRWCACTHFTETGRKKVVAAISEMLVRSQRIAARR
ncbi:MAG: hypothetical protein ACREDM_08200 [Methylocella sp.]